MMTLDTTYFLYQNKRTNEISKLPLTIRQLCRLILLSSSVSQNQEQASKQDQRQDQQQQQPVNTKNNDDNAINDNDNDHPFESHDHQQQQAETNGQHHQQQQQSTSVSMTTQSSESFDHYSQTTTTATKKEHDNDRSIMSLDTYVIQLIYRNSTNNHDDNKNNNDNTFKEEEGEANNQEDQMNDINNTVNNNGQYEYSPNGWMLLRTIPIIRDAFVDQYYYSINQVVYGPIPCRTLSKLYYGHDDSYHEQKSLPPIQDTTLLCSTSMSSSQDQEQQVQQWIALKELLYLQNAMEIWYQHDLNNINNNIMNPIHPPSQEQQQHISNDNDDKKNKQDNDDDDEDEEEEEEEGYESDGGTYYIRVGNDYIKGNRKKKTMIQSKNNDNKNNIGEEVIEKAMINNSTDHIVKQKKKNKSTFRSRNAKCWIYITGLPLDCTEQEVIDTFIKAGLLDVNPETLQPKIKLYTEENDKSLKGDASICYAKPESVELAISLFDQTSFRLQDSSNNATSLMSVQRAEFHAKQNNDTDNNNEHHNNKRKKLNISNTKRKVMKLANKQAITWDEGEFNGRLTGGYKGLRIVVFKNMFIPSYQHDDYENDIFFQELEYHIRYYCSTQLNDIIDIEKMTIFTKHPNGIILIKFLQPGHASTAVQYFTNHQHCMTSIIQEHYTNNNDNPIPSFDNMDSLSMTKKERLEWMLSFYNNPVSLSEKSSTMIEPITVNFWDGVTDYTTKATTNDNDEKQIREEEKEREIEFGQWLETEQLPPELQLQVEDDEYDDDDL